MFKYLIIFLILVSGCFRTQYSNFDPQTSRIVSDDPTQNAIRKSGSKPFFIWGLVPGEWVINAHQACGGTQNIAAIKTRKTFGQVILSLLIGELIYTPRSGAVYCHNSGSVPNSQNLPATTQVDDTKSKGLSSEIERLEELKKARDEGILTEKEYKSKRKAIIDSL